MLHNLANQLHRQTYCSDECSQLDAVSPSISSSSSVFSSPSINYAVGGEVPALVPSALGSALGNYRARDRYSLSSSSASSVSWSALTDEEDDINVGVEDESSMFNDAYIYEGSSKSSSLVHVAKSAGSSGLSYARRPSTTNHRSTIPSLHRRTSSSSSSGLAPGVPQSANSAEDDSFSAASSEFPAEHDLDFLGEQESGTVSQKPKRTRNRASLPAYFSLLQVSSPHRQSPISTSVGSRASPPTPKLAFATGTMTCASKVKSFISASGSSPAMQATPRGRPREAGTSRSRSRQSRSRSRSRNLSRPAHLQSESHLRDRMDSRSSVEKVFDWSCAPAVRGRTAVRRNSSPLPKMLLSALDFDENTTVRSGSANHTKTRTRGRIAVDELEGIGFSTEAPGFGVGRSGLLNREREVHRNSFGLR